MAHPIHVVPLDGDDMRGPSRFLPVCEAVARMTDQERGEMQRASYMTLMGGV
jgi:hypothetical protein